MEIVQWILYSDVGRDLKINILRNGDDRMIDAYYELFFGHVFGFGKCYGTK